ncbi:RHS repeat-associated core domain-containing protein [Mycetohabitans sp. B2]|nr:RHS repeat-associated core domain-containing protein [Mycetohabitans sp. B2]
MRYSLDNHLGSSTIELDAAGQLLTYEEYYPYGGTAVWAAKSEIEAKYKTVRYSGKERDATGLYYYGLRYYQPWVGRWLSADPAGTVDGLNLFGFVKNNPLNYVDDDGASAKDIALDAFDAILVVRKSAKKNLGIYRMSNTEVSIRAPINIISSAASIPIKGVVDVLTAPFFPVGPNPANIGTRVAFGLMQRNIYPNLVRASEYMNTDFLERQIHKKGPDKAVEALTFGVEPIAEALPIKSLKLQQDMERVDNSWKRLEGLTREKVEADYKETSKLLELVKQKEAAGLSALSQLDKPISGLDLHLYKLKRLEKAPISKAKAMENLDARLLERSAREATIYLEKLKSDLHDKLYPADKLRRRINANLNINQLRSGMHAYMAGKKWQRWAAAKSA